ncbi:MAG TPA: HEAT repeat domain-containing protein [Terriglobales bacterium]|nr:HEAT repeat domain-containing protein [Terriglobales bacterium]
MTGSIDELFTRTLCGEYEDEAPWEAVCALRRIGTRQVFERARELGQSSDVLSRARGAEVLAQLGKTVYHPSNSFPEESYSVITDLVQRETDSCPLASGIAALGHLDNPFAVPLIASFSSHPSPEIRFDVAFALGCFPNDPLSVPTLLLLMQDADDHVRDWATFGLGVQGDIDSDEIREALVRCLDDPDEDVREEAMVGLGKRKDQRVLSMLMARVEQPEITVRVIEAAYLMLGMDNEREGWEGAGYARALRQRFFSLTLSLGGSLPLMAAQDGN